MTPVTEIVKTKVPTKKVWKAWVDTYNQTNRKEIVTSQQKGFKVGRQGYLIDPKGKKAPYKITQMESGKSFTMSWGNILLRMHFMYHVEPQSKGSVVSCKVKFGGIFVFPISFFLRKKMRENLKTSLQQFVQQLEMQMMPQRRIYR